MNPSTTTPIVIVSAMAKETEALRACAIASSCNVRSSIPYYPVTLSGFDCILITTGIGQSYTAAMTALAIHCFNPHWLIFSGIAGTPLKHIALGDVVLGNLFFSSDLMPFFESEEITPCKSDPQDLPPTSVDGFLIPSKNQYRGNNKSFVVHTGTVATSDQFPLAQKMPQQFNGHPISAVDMESFAFAQICTKFQKKFAVVRGISNYVDFDTSHESVDLTIKNAQIASEHAALVTADLLKALLNGN